MNFSAIAAKYGDGYVRCIHKKILIDFMRITSFIILTLTISAQMLTASNVKGQRMGEVRVKLKLNRESLSDALEKIEKQTPFHFLYRNEEIREIGKLNLVETTTTLDKLLEALLSNSSLDFRQVNRHIVITKKSETSSTIANDKNSYNNPIIRADIDIRGRVIDQTKHGMPGVSVWLVGSRSGTTTDKDGNFNIKVPDSSAVLEFSYLGYLSRKVGVASGNYKSVTLMPDDNNLNEVVINTGRFERKAGTFTGAVAAFTGAELKQVTNQNVIQGLAILDPSFQILDNINLGSDPNNLPNIQLRGQTGIPENLENEFGNQPNQPLFILDGFETTLEKIYDLNINFVKSITLLKDAAAKSMYGSKAGNGVVVIETIEPQAGKLRLSYQASLNVTAPDLSSYELTNSRQKLQAELLAGKYSSADPLTQASLLRDYSINQKAMMDGVDTYWLSQPLQNGYGQRHTLMMDGGDQAMRYSANVAYNKTTGVMKGSDRTSVNGQFNLIYRVNNISFRNNLSIDRNIAKNSPYGSFSDYSRMNPYWRIYDDNGNLIPSYSMSSGLFNISGQLAYNPLYNASLNIKDGSNYTNVIENFSTEWNIVKNLRLSGRLGVSLQNNESELFYPASHTRYLNVAVTSPEYNNRGMYTVSNGKTANYNGDILLAYSVQAGRHLVYANAVYAMNQISGRSVGQTMVGFPNDKMDDITFGNGYAAGSKASGAENTSRTVSTSGAVNYSFDNRFLADFAYSLNGGSQFGRTNRWGGFWSTSVGWNLQNEQFIKNIEAIDRLRITASTGVTGTQGGNAYKSLARYRYITNVNYNGDLGMELMGLPNSDLMWQSVRDNNIGFDLGFLKAANLRVDYYIKDTKNLLSDQIVAPSAGFNSYAENIGEVRNKGFQVAASVRVFNNPKNRSNLNLFVNVAHNTNKISKVSNSLEQLNSAKDNAQQNGSLGTAEGRATLQNPSTRYEPNQSTTAIWVVPSLGIDPANGMEIYRKKDGSQTYVWSAADYVVGGDSNAKYTGSFGSNFQYKGFNANFAFSFRLGGQMYNSSLVTKVEDADFNYNVDIRALEERWKTPGQQSLYKDIALIMPTRPTSRFVQDLDELIFSSVSLSYNFNELNFMKQSRIKGLQFGVNLNDLARISTVRTERGLDYPYARTMSFSLSANF